MNTLHIKPAINRRVRKPDGTLLDDEGEVVERSSYWLRRVTAADVELIVSTNAMAPTAQPKTKK